MLARLSVQALEAFLPPKARLPAPDPSFPHSHKAWTLQCARRCSCRTCNQEHRQPNSQTLICEPHPSPCFTCELDSRSWTLRPSGCWQVPLQDLHLRRQRRLAYQALYAKAHTSCPTFVHPRRRWWQGRGRGSPHMSHREAAHLADLEERLSLSDVAHFAWVRPLTIIKGEPIT